MEDASLFQVYFSQERLIRYLTICKGNRVKAMELYDLNVRLCNAYRLLVADYYEVIFRNACDIKLATFFNNKNWLLQEYECTPFVNSKRTIAAIKRRFYRDGVTPTHTDLLTSLTLGFWTELFLPKPSKGLKGRPIQIFTNRPPRFSRSEAFNTLNKVRLFRNRIIHSEPIIFRRKQAVVSLYYAKKMYEEIYKVIGWIDPQLVSIVQKRESVLSELAKVEQEILDLIKR